jgi:5'-3' exonuclease
MSANWDDLAEITITKELKKQSNNLLLIDGVNIAFRYLHRNNYNNFTDDYIRTVTSLGNSYQAKRIICCFDAGASLYRKTMFPEYKANRKVERTEEEQERFTKFFDCLTHTIEELPFEHYKFKGIEADDIIAYFSLNMAKQYEHTWIVSSDRDLYQLLNEKVSIFNLFSRKEVDVDSLMEKYGLTPKEYAFSRIIEGDKGDNILGIEGIGPKRSAALVKEYKTLDNLLSSLPLKGRAKYITNLNNGARLLERNEKLINLIDYNEDVISCVEKEQLVTSMLEKALQLENS